MNKIIMLICITFLLNCNLNNFTESIQPIKSDIDATIKINNIAYVYDYVRIEYIIKFDGITDHAKAEGLIIIKNDKETFYRNISAVNNYLPKREYINQRINYNNLIVTAEIIKTEIYIDNTIL